MIYAKLDWYSCMLYNTSIEKILQKLRIETDLYEEMLNSCYERSYGFQSHAVFSMHGISCEIKWDDYLSTEQGTLFDTEFAKIRLDISGQGLDYLRQFCQIDKLLTTEDFWGAPEDFNVTRSDFAFDFVNYQPEFLDTFLNYIKDRERSGSLSARCSRLACSQHRNIQYSYRCGDQKTLYLGSTRGDKLLRIYDKLLQYSKNGVIVKPLPEAFKDEGEVTSWFRIEFQTRRKSASSYLFGINNDLSRVLRCMFDEYLVRDEQGKPLEFILDLYDWEKLPPIIQNAKFEPIERVLDHAHSYVTGQAFRSIFLLLLRYGADGFIKIINKRAFDMYMGSSSASMFGHIGLNNKIAQMLEEEGIKDVRELAGCNKQDNFIFIKQIKEKEKKYVRN